MESVCRVCGEQAITVVFSPDPGKPSFTAYPVCGFEHAEKIMLRDLGLMFLSARASSAEDPSKTEPVSSDATGVGTSLRAQTSAERT